MGDNVKKVFEILGVEPNEEFKLKYYEDEKIDLENLENYKIDEDLNIFLQKNGEWNPSLCVGIRDLLREEFIIIKLPKEKKKKLRDLTEEEYVRWRDKKCNFNRNNPCEKCLFYNVYCWSVRGTTWIYHKDLYSDKFLDQEIEIPEEAK